MFDWIKTKKPERAVLPPHPGPDDDGISRIIPKASFEGEGAEFYRKIGRTPDDPENLVLTQDLLNARLDARKANQAVFLTAAHSILPKSCKVIPWAMVPYSIWQGKHADFLYRILDMYPMEPWNTMLLAENAQTAFVLDLPEHARCEPSALTNAADRCVGEIIETVKDAHQDVLRSLEQTSWAEFGRFSDVIEKAKIDMRKLAKILARGMYGEVACDNHVKVFGNEFSWVGR